MHWFWQSALAGLAVDDSQAPPREMLEQYLLRFANSVSPRADISAAGLMFATATTIALGDRPSPATVAATAKLGQIVQRMRTVETHRDLRLLAIHRLWQHEQWRSSNIEVHIPLNRIQIFSPQLLERADFESVNAFIAKARTGKLSSRDADDFVASSSYSILLTSDVIAQNYSTGRLLIGVTPELYDSAVRALIDSDNLSYGSVDRAIESVAEQAPFWPDDLVPGKISSRDGDLRAGLLARVVVHADRCGLLVPLFEQAKSKNASRHLHQLAQLFRRYEEIRLLGYRAVPFA
jgi:hypothetical protein